ncbi:hypothetical protein BDQ17DRAFT_1513790 [Cyathus striatus]|nr:hypothetical protein BDQ17DRAFT_1513790 [Cyathus striatus]
MQNARISDSDRIFLSNSDFACEYNLNDYRNLDPDFLYDPNIPRKQRIERLIQKLPLEHLPEELRPQYLVGIQPPKFYFGFPVNSKELCDIATKNGFAVLRPSEHPNEHDLHLKGTMKALREKISADLQIDCIPDVHLAKSTAKYCMPVLAFLTSYDFGIPAPPEELNTRIRDYLKVDESLMCGTSGRFIYGPDEKEKKTSVPNGNREDSGKINGQTVACPVTRCKFDLLWKHVLHEKSMYLMLFMLGARAAERFSCVLICGSIANLKAKFGLNIAHTTFQYSIHFPWHKYLFLAFPIAILVYILPVRFNIPYW